MGMARTVLTNPKKKVKSIKTKSSKVARKRAMSVKPPTIEQSPIKPKVKKLTKPSQKVLSEIKYYQNMTECLIPKATFNKQLREILNKICLEKNIEGMRLTRKSAVLLQESVEAYITSLMETSYFCSSHAKRVTLFSSDVKLVKKITKNKNIDSKKKKKFFPKKKKKKKKKK